MNPLKTLLPFLLLPAAYAADQAPTPEELRFKVLLETKIIVVEKPGVPLDEFLADGDPNTLEIVMLSKGEEGPSRVTADGEVIFDNGATEDEKTALMDQAISIRVQRRSPGT